MPFINTILDNVWFISISASLIATAIAFCASQISGRIKHKKRITEANNFVVNHLRSYIVNADIPSDKILTALINSTARQFDLSPDELLPASGYIEEAVAEIIGNTYLKAEDQIRYLEQIDNYFDKHPTLSIPKLAPTSIYTALLKFLLIFMVFLAYFSCVILTHGEIWSSVQEYYNKYPTPVSIDLFYVASWLLDILAVGAIFLTFSLFIPLIRKSISDFGDTFNLFDRNNKKKED